MSGLLEKDICLLLKGHRNTMILFLMICVFLGLSQTDTFILGYFPFLMIVLLIGTLSCDEADNGLPFLFTLPIDRNSHNSVVMRSSIRPSFSGNNAPIS